MCVHVSHLLFYIALILIGPFIAIYSVKHGNPFKFPKYSFMGIFLGCGLFIDLVLALIYCVIVVLGNVTMFLINSCYTW